MYSEYFIDIMQNWNIPEQFYPKMHELVDKYGQDMVFDCMPYTYVFQENTIKQLEKDLQDNFLFSVDSWRKAKTILGEALNCFKLDYFCIMNLEEIISVIERKDILTIYTDQNNKILFAKGSKTINDLAETLVETAKKVTMQD